MEIENKAEVNYSYTYEDKLLQENLDNRRLFLNEEIDDDVISSTVFNIIRFNKLDDGIPVDERKPILLYMNTLGGSMFDAMGLVDAITTSITPVYTVNLAMCASAGFSVFIAGKKRFAMPHSTFLMHDGSMVAMDSTAKTKDLVDFLCGEYENQVMQHVLDHTKIESDYYEEKYRKEWWILPHEAKERGIVDYIIGEDCDISEIL